MKLKPMMILACVIIVAASSVTNFALGSFGNQVSLNQGTTITMPTEYITNCFSTMEGVVTVTYICIMHSYDNTVTFATLFTENFPTPQNSIMAYFPLILLVIVVILFIAFVAYVSFPRGPKVKRLPVPVNSQVKERHRASGHKDQGYCGHCGSKLPPTSKYCNKCGSAVGE